VGGAFLGLSYWDLPYTVVAIIALCRGLVDKELTRMDTDIMQVQEVCESPAKQCPCHDLS